MAGNTVLHYAVLLEDDERMCVSLLNANADTMVGHPGENWWFILSTSPLELDIICGRLAYD